MDQHEEFKSRIFGNAETLVKEFFPQKIAQFDAFLHEEEFSLGNIAKVKKSTQESFKNVHMVKPESGERGEKKQITFKSNEYIISLVERIKPEIVSLLEAVNTLRMWVVLLIPKIEDGNNFGVEVQEETLSELKAVEHELVANQEEIAGYFLSRAKVVSQLIKKPGVKDYCRFLEEEDEKQFVGLRLMVAELRNASSTIYDIISKNISKIKSPRSEGAMSSIY